LAENWNCRIDFEISDAIKKLERFGIAHIESNRIHCLSIDDAKKRLDNTWDNFFVYGR
jgi:hypothetical protein